MKQGVYDNLTNAAYHGDKSSYSSTLIKKMAVPAEAYFYMTTPQEPKEAYRLGGAIHKWILERDDFEAEFLTGISCARRSRADKEAWANWFTAHGADGGEITFNNPAAKWNGLFEQQSGMCMVKPEEIEAIELMASSIMRNENASELLSKGEAESSLFWTDDATGLLLKVRPDYLNDSFISDLKSIQSVDDWTIDRAIANFGYGISAQMYINGCHEITGEFLPFIFIFIGKEKPYPCRVISLSDNESEKAWDRYQYLKQKLCDCLQSNDWPGIPDDLDHDLFAKRGN